MNHRCVWIWTIFMCMLHASSGLKCFICRGCSDGGETVSDPRNMEECQGGLCLSSRLVRSEPYGTQRRSCTNATLGVAGTCELTPFMPNDNHFEKESDYGYNSSMFRTCYCSHVDGCNGSNLHHPTFAFIIILMPLFMYQFL